MSKISDEMREWAGLLKCSAYTNTTAEKISALADRIDAEMIELPRDADGKPIHVGETMYGLRGRGRMVVSLRLYGEEDPTWMVNIGTDACVHPSCLAHELQDSLERIADEIEKADVDGCTDWADRIRKFAKERRDE